MELRFMVMPPSMSLYLDHNVSESCAVLAAVWFTLHFSGEMDGESVPGKDIIREKNCIFSARLRMDTVRFISAFQISLSPERQR